MILTIETTLFSHPNNYEVIIFFGFISLSSEIDWSLSNFCTHFGKAGEFLMYVTRGQRNKFLIQKKSDKKMSYNLNQYLSLVCRWFNFKCVHFFIVIYILRIIQGFELVLGQHFNVTFNISLWNLSGSIWARCLLRHISKILQKYCICFISSKLTWTYFFSFFRKALGTFKKELSEVYDSIIFF